MTIPTPAQPTQAPLPYSEEAEIAVLSSALIDAEAARRVAKLDEAAFYKEANRRIFRAIVRLQARGGTVEPVGVHDELSSTDELKGIGGVAYLARLVDAVPTAEHLDQHVGILLDKLRRRRLIEEARELIREAGTGDPLESADRIVELARRNGRTAGDLIVARLSDAIDRDLRWWWEHRIIDDHVNLVAGPGGSGKSTLINDCAARWTKGEPLQGETQRRDPANVMMRLTEDPDWVVRKRVEEAGGDTDRVFTIEGKGDPEYPITVGLSDIPMIREEMKARDCRILVLDALKDFARLKDDYRESEVRAAMEPLKRMAREDRVAIIGIVHFGKSHRAAADAIMGSAAWRDNARSVLAVSWLEGRDGPRGVGVAKRNHAPDVPVLVFDLQPSGDVARVVWEAEPRDGLTADDLVPAPRPSSEERSAIDEAKDYLLAALEDGPRDAESLWKETERRTGVSQRTIQRARASLKDAQKIKSEPVRDEKGKLSGWTWMLKNHPVRHECENGEQGGVGTTATRIKTGDPDDSSSSPRPSSPTPRGDVVGDLDFDSFQEELEQEAGA